MASTYPAGYHGTLCSVSLYWRSCRDHLHHSWPGHVGPMDPVPALLDLDRSGPLPPVSVLCRYELGGYENGSSEVKNFSTPFMV